MKLLKLIKLWISKRFRKKIYKQELRKLIYYQKYLEHNQRKNKKFREEMEKYFNETRK